MADERATSVAKDIHLESYANDALSSYEELSREFGSVVNKSGREDANKGGEEEGKEHAPEPEHNLRAPPEMAQEQDRNTFNERQASLSEDYARDVLGAYEEQLQRDNEGLERSNDFDNSMGR